MVKVNRTIRRVYELSEPKKLVIELIGAVETGGVSLELEERVGPWVQNQYSTLETLYFTSGLIREIVNRYADGIAGQGFYFTGKNQDINKEYEAWAKRVKLKSKIKTGIRDIFLGGGTWGELAFNEDETDIAKIIVLNPTIMDFIRDGKQKVKLMDDGTIEGFKRQESGKVRKIEWHKNEITEGGKTKLKSKRGHDCRWRIYYLKLWDLSESYLGDTPLISIYKDEHIRLNIADATGESAFQGTGIIATISSPEGMEIPAETMTQLEEELKAIRSKTIFVFPEEIKLERFPLAEMREMHYHLDFFTNVVCTGCGIKREVLMTPTLRVAGINLQEARADFENKIMILQEELADQINDQIIKVRARLKNTPEDEIPEFHFLSKQKAIKLSRARRLATLARSNLLTWDPEIEIQIREEEGLPTSLLSKLKNNWSPDKASFIKKEPDIGEIVKETLKEILEEKEIAE